jgi:O-antigen/teichoic acid export membrane protein
MTRTRRFLRGLSLSYFNQALVALVGLWLTPFLLHRLGKEDFGLWQIGSQWLAYLTLVDLGVLALLPREVAYATGRSGGAEQAADLPTLIGQSIRLLLWQVPFVALAAVVLYVSMPPRWEALRGPLGWVMLSYVLLFPLYSFYVVLQGLQDMVFLGWVHFGYWLLNLVVSIVLAYVGCRLYALMAGAIALQVFLCGACWYRCRSRFPYVLPTHLPALPWPEARRRLVQGFWYSLARLAQVLLGNTDLVIIGALLEPEATVPFVCTAKLISVLGNQPQLFMHLAAPGVSEVKASQSPERLFGVSTALSQAMLLVSGAVVCVVLVVNQGFVTWWPGIGAEQYGGFLLSLLLVLSMLLRHWNTTVVQVIFCFGYERLIALTTLLDGLVTVGGAVFFVWLYGPLGAPLGSILGVCLVSLPTNLAAQARESGVSLTSLLAALGPWFWRFTLLAVAAGALANAWVPTTLVTLALTTVGLVLVYGAVMLPVALRPPLGDYLRPQLALLRDRLFRPVTADRVDA